MASQVSNFGGLKNGCWSDLYFCFSLLMLAAEIGGPLQDGLGSYRSSLGNVLNGILWQDCIASNSPSPSFKVQQQQSE